MMGPDHLTDYESFGLLTKQIRLTSPLSYMGQRYLGIEFVRGMTPD